MAIAFGGINSATTWTTTQTLTSLPVSGINTVGIVLVIGDVGADNITAVTWGGVSMTKIAAVITAGDRYHSFWWIANPASSSTIAFTGASTWNAFNMYYTGCSQTGQPDSFNTNTNTGTTLTASSTVVKSNCWLVMSESDSSGRAASGVSGDLTAIRGNETNGLVIADSGGIVGTGSQSGSITVTGTSVNQSGIIFSLAPSGGGTSRSFRTLLGVGT